MNSYINMEFAMESNFSPNINKSERLKVINVTPSSVIIEMYNPNCKGVFPTDSFEYWIKKGALIPIQENLKELVNE
ncbi:hypothetical protein KDN24_17110 [Bacillus sp. Bva_UNVM-123]